jgi:hypothetical protein
MKTFSLCRRRFLSVLLHLVLCVTAATIPSAQAQTSLFRDDFNAATLDSTQWTVYDAQTSYGRTQFGNRPSLLKDADGTNYARLKLSTYNYNNNLNFPLKGTEMYSKLFTLGVGKEFTARVRSNIVQGGIVSAFWTYGSRGVYGASDFNHDEIDFEYLSNLRPNNLLLTTWNDWNGRWGYNDGIHHSESKVNVPFLNWLGWNTYKIRWLPDRIEWLVNDVLCYSSTRALPNDAMSLRLNIWAPDSSWTAAYDATLKAAPSASTNTDYYYDVDWVEVKDIAPAATSGNGLSASYYNGTAFNQLKLARVDPELNFDWGSGSPSSTAGITVDNFSARWTGKVQAQYNENYTFYARSDDGVRVWVNNQLLIDRWVNQAPTEYGGTIALVAGQKYDIRVEYYEAAGGAVSQLRWSSPSTPKAIVPQRFLYSS